MKTRLIGIVILIFSIGAISSFGQRSVHGIERIYKSNGKENNCSECIAITLSVKNQAAHLNMGTKTWEFHNKPITGELELYIEALSLPRKTVVKLDRDCVKLSPNSGLKLIYMSGTNLESDGVLTLKFEATKNIENGKIKLNLSAWHKNRPGIFDCISGENVITVPINVKGIRPKPTCDDGIKNGDEEGIDCGGSKCPPCKVEIDPCDGLYTAKTLEQVYQFILKTRCTDQQKALAKMRSLDERLWKGATSYSDYEEYITLANRYSDKYSFKYIEEAKRRRDKIEKDTGCKKAWIAAERIGTVEAFQDFIAKHSTCSQKNIAENAISRLRPIEYEIQVDGDGCKIVKVRNVTSLIYKDTSFDDGLDISFLPDEDFAIRLCMKEGGNFVVTLIDTIWDKSKEIPNLTNLLSTEFQQTDSTLHYGINDGIAPYEISWLDKTLGKTLYSVNIHETTFSISVDNLSKLINRKINEEWSEVYQNTDSLLITTQVKENGASEASIFSDSELMILIVKDDRNNPLWSLVGAGLLLLTGIIFIIFFSLRQRKKKKRIGITQA